jgi:hypothetical protein
MIKNLEGSILCAVDEETSVALKDFFENLKVKNTLKTLLEFNLDSASGKNSHLTYKPLWGLRLPAVLKAGWYCEQGIHVVCVPLCGSV